MRNPMRDDWTSHIKMRGSIWGLLAGLLLGIAAYAWSGAHQDPLVKQYLDCEHREWDQRKIYSRPPAPIIKEIDEKCRREM